ncbi:MAG: DUF2795 domain-containing protein [Actinobacteria bacterium]|nr:DUF2795 domain-containing protein [Actinomycetota bacterium]
MDRESSKHGPQLDDEMAHETEDVVRSGHASHTEEWRQPEPIGDLRQPRPEAEQPPAGPNREDVEARSVLARALGPGTFPANAETIRRRAEEADLPAPLTDAIGALPAGQSYRNVGDLARALGLETED